MENNTNCRLTLRPGDMLMSKETKPCLVLLFEDNIYELQNFCKALEQHSFERPFSG